MKTVLIFLASLAVALGIFAYFAVFGAPTGSYSVSPMINQSDITSSSLLGETISTSSLSASSGTASFSTSFPTPPLVWPEGQSKISISAISLEDNQLSFSLSVQTGGAPECIPLNLRLVADEEGDLDPPNPASFSFPDSGNCNGAPNRLYANQAATFTVDPTTLPLLFTTGGASNIFFEVATTTGKGLQVDFPGTSG